MVPKSPSLINTEGLLSSCQSDVNIFLKLFRSGLKHISTTFLITC